MQFFQFGDDLISGPSVDVAPGPLVEIIVKLYQLQVSRLHPRQQRHPLVAYALAYGLLVRLEYQRHTDPNREVVERSGVSVAREDEVVQCYRIKRDSEPKKAFSVSLSTYSDPHRLMVSESSLNSMFAMSSGSISHTPAKNS